MVCSLNNNFMIRKFLAIVFAIMICPAVWGGEAIVLHLTGSRSVVIPFDDAAEITFSDAQVNFGQRSYPLAEVVRYEFSNGDDSGIEAIEGPMKGIVIDPAGYIDFAGIGAEAADIAVYSVAGVAMPYDLSGSVIDISELSPGVYVVHIGSSTFKMQKR